MKSTNHSNTNKTNKTNQLTSKPNPWTPESLASIRTIARDYPNPVDYRHPYPSMAQFPHQSDRHVPLERPCRSKPHPVTNSAGPRVCAPLLPTRAAQGLALRALLRLLSSYRKSLPLARATSFGKTFGLGSAGSRPPFPARCPSPAVGSALSQMRPGHETASLNQSLPNESRATRSKTSSTSSRFCRMNARSAKKIQHS